MKLYHLKSLLSASVMILMSFAPDLYAQVIVPQDGVYDKIVVPKKTVVNSGIDSFFNNSMFCSHQRKLTDEYKMSDSVFEAMTHSDPLTTKDFRNCVHFIPVREYVYNDNQQSGGCFFLNHIPEFALGNEPVLPYSLRFRIDTTELTFFPGLPQLIFDSNIRVPVREYLTDFYFCKYEVTNAEYREFVNWVRDSIARTLLFNGGKTEYGKRIVCEDYLGYSDTVLQLNWAVPVDWSNIEILEPLFFPNHERFYKRREVDPRKLNYRYQFEKDGAMTHTVINIAPDSLSWEEDYPTIGARSLAICYGFHPVYRDYPVAGVTFGQAKAFLNWKTKKEQSFLDAAGANYTLEFALPTEREWEIAATATLSDDKIQIYSRNYYALADDSWITDLALTENDVVLVDEKTSDTSHIIFKNCRTNLMRFSRGSVQVNYNSMWLDGLKYTHPATIEKKFRTHINGKSRKVPENIYISQNKDDLGICFMGGNVSEWIDESYAENWKPMFELRQRILDSIDAPDAKLQAQIERYFDAFNDPDGYLIRGGNWMDERYSFVSGKNVEGTNAKRFVNPLKSFATVGFRYVIHVKPKPPQ